MEGTVLLTFPCVPMITTRLSAARVLEADGHITVAVESPTDSTSHRISGFPIGNQTVPLLYVFERIVDRASVTESDVALVGGEFDSSGNVIREVQDAGVLCFSLRAPRLSHPSNRCFLLSERLFSDTMDFLFDDVKRKSTQCETTEMDCKGTQVASCRVSCLNSAVADLEMESDMSSNSTDDAFLNSESESEFGSAFDSGSESESESESEFVKHKHGSGMRGCHSSGTRAPRALHSIGPVVREIYDRLIAGRMLKLQVLWRRRGFPITAVGKRSSTECLFPFRLDDASDE